MLFDNSNKLPVLVAEKEINEEIQITNENLFDEIKTFLKI
jgi:hypothetical protein